ncbi:AAEL009053-PA [Aedes aegypti]|uniref:AAEL009053-PA n=1 Tax=Aedes aegypti TaxID=7159 RepID=Q16WY8_AEDAE|nr:AAEL009053-PA [Aedes aegypti]
MANVKVELIKSSRGNDMLAIAGYVFHCNRKMVENNIYNWECRVRCHAAGSNNKCAARARSTIVNGQHKILGISEHNHQPNPISSQVMQFRDKLKRRAESDNGGVAKAIQETLSDYPSEVQGQMSEGARRKIVERVRSRTKPVPDPTSLDDFVVPNEYQTDNNGDRMLIADVVENHERAIIFGTHENLRRLGHAKYWVADGTFATVPSLFRQLVTVHGSIAPTHQQTVPLIYVLMTTKTESLYRKVWEAIIEAADALDIDLEPEYVITDFEKALINSVQAEFPDAQHSGCFFHWSKNLFKFIQQNKMLNEFGQDASVYLTFKKVQALAFLPPDDIAAAFETVKQQAPENMAAFFSYVEETYICGRMKRSSRGKKAAKIAPLFPPTFWSVYANVLDKVSRTSNQAESWHNRWTKIVGAKHVGVVRILEEIKREIRYSAGLIAGIQSGSSVQQKKQEDAIKEARILDIVQNYVNYLLPDYLTAIATNLSSK